jgi:hypothetical protein
LVKTGLLQKNRQYRSGGESGLPTRMQRNNTKNNQQQITLAQAPGRILFSYFCHAIF